MPEIIVNSAKCVACGFCEIACAVNRSSLSKTLVGAAQEEVRPQSRVRLTFQKEAEINLPVQCRHCEGAPCVDTCPAKALYRDESNAVFLDETKCIGCWMCVAVCPFGAISPSRVQNVAFKCDRCVGCPYPYCVNACPTGALLYEEKEVAAKVCAPTEFVLDIIDGHACELVRLDFKGDAPVEPVVK